MFLVTVHLSGCIPDQEGECFETERAARAHINHEVQWHLERGFCMCDLPVWTLWEAGSLEPVVASRFGVAPLSA